MKIIEFPDDDSKNCQMTSDVFEEIESRSFQFCQESFEVMETILPRILRTHDCSQFQQQF